MIAVDELASTRVEVVTDIRGATALPWELLCDPDTRTTLALHAGSFVRTHPDSGRLARLPDDTADRVRILLVICRPKAGKDVPFRSVAARIVKGLDESSRDNFQLDVLRPPTFPALTEALRQAHQAGRPYHVVHFDGHGTHLELEELFKQWHEEGDASGVLARLLELDENRFYSPEVLYPRPVRKGSHGYLVFENPDGAANHRLVDGPELAGVLIETGVPVLILNACRSAHAEPQTENGGTADGVMGKADVHARRPAPGSGVRWPRR